MRASYVAAAILFATPVFAEQPASIEQRIGAQIGALIIQNQGLTIQLEQLQNALALANARAKALEDKYEPKIPDPASAPK